MAQKLGVQILFLTLILCRMPFLQCETPILKSQVFVNFVYYTSLKCDKFEQHRSSIQISAFRNSRCAAKQFQPLTSGRLSGKQDGKVLLHYSVNDLSLLHICRNNKAWEESVLLCSTETTTKQAQNNSKYIQLSHIALSSLGFFFTLQSGPMSTRTQAESDRRSWFLDNEWNMYYWSNITNKWKNIFINDNYACDVINSYP